MMQNYNINVYTISLIVWKVFIQIVCNDVFHILFGVKNSIQKNSVAIQPYLHHTPIISSISII
jgi:hypothetical protein